LKKLTNLVLYAFILILPFRYILWITDTWNAQKVLVLALFACALLLWLRREFIVAPALLVFVGGVMWLRLSTSLLAALNGPYEFNLKETFSSVQFLLLFILIASLVTAFKELQTLFRIYIVAGVLTCIAYLTEYYLTAQLADSVNFDKNVPLRRAGLYRQLSTVHFGPFHMAPNMAEESIAGNPIHLSFFLLALLPINVYLIEQQLKNRRIGPALLSASALLLNIITIILTYSRAAFVIMVILGILFVYSKRTAITPGRIALGLACAAVLLTALSYFGATQRLLFRLTQFDAIVKLNPELEPSAQMRSQIYWSEARLIRDHPLIGLGYFNFDKEGWRYSGLLPEDHTGESLFLQTLAEGGCVFVAGLVVMWYWLFCHLPPRSNGNQRCRKVLSISVIVMMIMSFTIWTEMEYHLYVILGMLFSAALRQFDAVRPSDLLQPVIAPS
jgi:O-antigen ligase